MAGPMPIDTRSCTSVAWIDAKPEDNRPIESVSVFDPPRRCSLDRPVTTVTNRWVPI